MGSELLELARPFPARYVKVNPSGGGVYVTHAVVTQRLLHVVGPYDFSVVEILRGYVAEKEPNPQAQSARGRKGSPALDNAVVGAVCRLTCEVDYRTVRVEEVGDCEDPHNWPHDGARLKDALSDAIKRCAMRLGLGLALWCKEDDPPYFLFDRLRDKEGPADGNVREPRPEPEPERPGGAEAELPTSPTDTVENLVEAFGGPAVQVENVPVTATVPVASGPETEPLL
jgi:hypothetical protein